MKKSDHPQLAVALAYSAGKAAPQVVAKGRGFMAEAIIERARGAALCARIARTGFIVDASGLGSAHSGGVVFRGG